MIHLYELAQEHNIVIPSNFFTDVYVIEKKIQRKTATTIDILNLVYIVITGNRGGSLKKAYACLLDFYEKNNLEMKII